MIDDSSQPSHASPLWDGPLPTLADAYKARAVVRTMLDPTPLVQSDALSERLGFTALVKCENLLPTGAFKIRGGLYLLSRLPEEKRRLGVVAASTGNHGQSIAAAAQRTGTRATIFMPEVANPLKVASIQRFGAMVMHAGADFRECFTAARQYAQTHGAHFIHSANEPDLIAGVATHTIEVMEAHPDIDAIFVPIGGGSGLCGACIVGKGINPNLKVYGVQAAGAPAVYESWKARRLRTLPSPNTFAEGLATSEAYSLPAAILWDQVDDILLVTDSELRRSLLTLLETTRTLAEGAGAAAYQKREDLAGKKVAIIVSGGNLTLESLQQAMAEEHAW